MVQSKGSLSVRSSSRSQDLDQVGQLGLDIFRIRDRLEKLFAEDCTVFGKHSGKGDTQSAFRHIQHPGHGGQIPPSQASTSEENRFEHFMQSGFATALVPSQKPAPHRIEQLMRPFSVEGAFRGFIVNRNFISEAFSRQGDLLFDPEFQGPFPCTFVTKPVIEEPLKRGAQQCAQPPAFPIRFPECVRLD